jgi:signal transduction histidine kinase
MPSRAGLISRYLWPLVVAALPLALLVSSLVTFREFQEMKQVYLRNQAALIAGRLETLPPERFTEGLESLAAEEPSVVDIRVFTREEKSPESAVIEPIWRGQELFKVQELRVDGEGIFRVYVPFHWRSELRVARIDLAVSAADSLVAHARHNVLIASVSSLALLLLSIYALWSARRAERLQRRQLELEHLAHLGTLSAVLAHEIRNPLGTIKGFAQLAAEKADPATTALLEPILAEIRRLEKLVADLLLYGRPPAPSLRSTEWQALAAELEAYAREAIGQRPIRCTASGEAWRFQTDPDLLKQALLNLVRNSVEALEETGGGEVRLKASRGSGGGLVIAVEDNGPGLPEQVRARLFEPFQTTKASGTGLGLSIARKLVAALGGRLELTPLNPHGTRAQLVFPNIVVE